MVRLEMGKVIGVDRDLEKKNNKVKEVKERLPDVREKRNSLSANQKDEGVFHAIRCLLGRIKSMQQKGKGGEFAALNQDREPACHIGRVRGGKKPIKD